MWGAHVVHHHAAAVRVRIEFGVRVRVTATRDNPLDEAQIQPTHHVSVVLGDQVKRTIPQADAAIVAGVGQVAAVAQRPNDVAACFAARAPAGFGGGSVHGRSHCSAGILLDRCDKQSGEEFVVAGRHADASFPAWRGCRASPGARPPVRRAQRGVGS